MNIIKEYLFTILFGVFVLSIILFFSMLFAYVDIVDSNLCYISLYDDMLKGNKDTMRKALWELKKTDYASYQTTCRYVNSIYEGICTLGNQQGQPLVYVDAPGCYIKGSKSLYLVTEKEDSDEVVKRRAESIKKYSSFSKKYWEER